MAFVSFAFLAFRASYESGRNPLGLVGAAADDEEDDISGEEEERGGDQCDGVRLLDGNRGQRKRT